MLCVFEDTEAVIKMRIKGRSPTMRHVSRSHRVSFDWLLDRINLDPKIQRYFDTKHQIADILTKGNFTRDEWNKLLYLFNISHFSALCCAKNFSLTSCTRTIAGGRIFLTLITVMLVGLCISDDERPYFFCCSAYPQFHESSHVSQ